jgi:hypothetical protein
MILDLFLLTAVPYRVHNEFHFPLLDSNFFDAAAECKRLQALGPGARRCHLIAALICAIPKETRPVLRDINSDEEGEREHYSGHQFYRCLDVVDSSV